MNATTAAVANPAVVQISQNNTSRFKGRQSVVGEFGAPRSRLRARSAEVESLSRFERF